MPPSDTQVIRATLDFIEAKRGSLLLHAGAAALESGDAVVVHGASGAGKTTLTAALVGEGLAYITDETVCIDPVSLVIEPFLKPLTVKPGSQELLRHLEPPAAERAEDSDNWQVAPGRLGGPSVSGQTLTASAIVFPDIDEELNEVEVTPVSPARAAFVLGEQSSALWAIAPRPLAPLARLVLGTPAYSVSYSNAFDAARTIARDLLPAATPPTNDSVLDAREPEPTGTNGPRRARGVDWVILGGEAVLFDGEHLHHLDGPGTAVWLALDGSLPLQGVAQELADHFEADVNGVLLDVEDLVRVLAARNLVSE